MYFIYSNDRFLLNKQLEKIVSKLKNEFQDVEINEYSWIEDSDEKILEDILSSSFFVDKKIIVVKDAYFLTEKKKESSWIQNNKENITKLFSYNLNNFVIFTLNEEKISNKLKLTKLFEKNAKLINVQALTFDQTVQYVDQKINHVGKKMHQKVIQNFLERLPNDMQIISNELNKLLNLNTKIIDFDVLDNNISHYYESDVYKLSDYFQTNQIKLFIQEFNNYIASSSDLIRLLYLLNTNLTFNRDVLILQKQGKNPEMIANLLKAHPYRVKVILNKKSLTIKELNDKIIVLYNLNKVLIKGLINPIINTELELIKNMSI